MRLVKLESSYKGWTGENCWRTNGRRFIKRFEHRRNRQYGKSVVWRETAYVVFSLE